MSIRIAERMQGVERTLIRRIFDAAPPDAINLGLGQPDLPTPEAVALAGIAGIAGGRTGYTSTAGLPELRAAVAAGYGDHTRGADGVVITVGSQEAMFAACLTLLDPGTELLYPDPGYPAYPVVARLLGAHPVAYPLRPDRAWRPDPEDIAARLSDRTRAVILCSPSNPTGASTGRTGLEPIVALLRARDIPWISDEIYSGFVYGEPHVSPAELAPGGGLVVSGLSKDLSMTGWRLGWVAGPPEVVGRVTAAHQYLVTCAPAPSQVAALAAFGPDGRAARERYRERFRTRRAVMLEELERIPGVRAAPPDGAFYVFADVSAHGDSLALARRILENRGVVTVPGEAFGANGAGWLRLSFAASEERIREGVRRIGAELATAG